MLMQRVYCQGTRLGNLGRTDKYARKFQGLPFFIPFRRYETKVNAHQAVEVKGSAHLNAVRWTVAGKLNE